MGKDLNGSALCCSLTYGHASLSSDSGVHHDRFRDRHCLSTLPADPTCDHLRAHLPIAGGQPHRRRGALVLSWYRYSACDRDSWGWMPLWKVAIAAAADGSNVCSATHAAAAVVLAAAAGGDHGAMASWPAPVFPVGPPLPLHLAHRAPFRPPRGAGRPDGKPDGGEAWQVI